MCSCRTWVSTNAICSRGKVHVSEEYTILSRNIAKFHAFSSCRRLVDNFVQNEIKQEFDFFYIGDSQPVGRRGFLFNIIQFEYY